MGSLMPRQISRFSCYLLSPEHLEISSGTSGDQFPLSFVPIRLHGAEHTKKLQTKSKCSSRHFSNIKIDLNTTKWNSSNHPMSVPDTSATITTMFCRPAVGFQNLLLVIQGHVKILILSFYLWIYRRLEI